MDLTPDTRTGSRLLRFLVTGGVATLAHWLVMAALVEAGLDPRLATAAGATVGLVLNYLGQHRFTFTSALRHRVAFPRYLGGAMLGWCLNLAIFSALLHFELTITVAQLLATGLVTLFNFKIAQRYVFHDNA